MKFDIGEDKKVLTSVTVKGIVLTLDKNINEFSLLFVMQYLLALI